MNSIPGVYYSEQNPNSNIPPLAGQSQSYPSFTSGTNPNSVPMGGNYDTPELAQMRARVDAHNQAVEAEIQAKDKAQQAADALPLAD